MGCFGDAFGMGGELGSSFFVFFCAFFFGGCDSLQGHFYLFCC